MIKHVCDICGNDVKTLGINPPRIEIYSRGKKTDICPNCAYELMEWIKSRNILSPIVNDSGTE